MRRQVHAKREWSHCGALSLALWVVTIISIGTRWNLVVEPLHSSTCLQQREFIHDTYNHANGSAPLIAWLMSFPNSGTSYTLRIVRQVSNMTTATNYGDEYQDGTNSSVLWGNRTNGPFRAYPDFPIPTEFILTKTHCASRCVHCGPDGYLETPLSFQRGCLRSTRVQNGTETESYYSRTQVRRAVHLIRHPLDNIVARFHLSRRHDGSQLPDNATGFHDWCRNLDSSYTWMEQHTRWIDPNLRHSWRGIPCHAEFFRWIQWHNLAYVTGIEMGLDVTILKYEDYHTDWEGTLKDIFRFLHLPFPNNAGVWQEASPFLMRSYHHYFSKQQKYQIRKLMMQFASVPVWKLIQDYFDDELSFSNLTHN